MTDTHENLIKDVELINYFNMATEALEANDVNQALEISNSGLEQAKSEDNGEWVDKFNSLQEKLEKNHLTPSIVKEDITLIKGIGTTSAENLHKVGITSIGQLATMTVDELSKIRGIGPTTAEKIIQGAKSHNKTKGLDKFSPAESAPKFQEDFREEIDYVEFEEEDEINEIDGSTHIEAITPSQIKKSQETPYIRPIPKFKKELVEKDFKLTLDASTPIVVDGSNVAWMGVDRDTGGFPKIEYLIGLIKKLEDIGFMDIAIFIDPGLHRNIDDPDKLESLINSGKIHRVRSRGKKEKDDHYILQYARIKDTYIIVESELYRNFSKHFPDRYPRRWIEERRIEVKIVDGVVMFTPEIEISEDSKKKTKNNTKSQIEPWFDPKYRIKRGESHVLPLKQSQSDIEELNIQEYKEEFHENYKVEVEEDVPRDIEVPVLIEPQVSISHDLKNLSMAVHNHEEMQALSQKTCAFLKKNEFHVIQKSSELQKVYHGIDILALKVIRIKGTREVICVIPIILSSVNRPLTVSLDKITRSAKDDNASPAINRKLDSYITTLSNACTLIRANLGDEGALFAYLNHNLQLNLTVERTRSHKNLYFRSGPVHYKLVVTPILVSQHRVGFTEKVLSFAYQKDLDLHVVDLMNFSYVLQYLDLKYFQIETYNKEQSAIILNNEGSVKLMNLVRKSSIIFMGLGLAGILFLVLALLQGFPVLVVNSLGYGAIVLYGIILGFFYVANYRRISLINRKFEIPYHKRSLILDDASLVLIREDLPPKLMEQFVYESLDTKYKSKVITNIKLNGAQDFIRKKSLEKEANEDTLFEKKDKNKDEPSLDGSLLKKYGTFMED